MEKTKNIILLHGFGEDSRVFTHQITALSQMANVFAPDLPGSGLLHSYPLPATGVSIEWLCDWVLEFALQKGLTQFILLGHSMGGYITLAFAEKYPEKLQGFGLIHSTAFADSEEKKSVRLKAIDFISEKGGFTFLKTAIPNLFGETFRKQEPEVVADLTQRANQFANEWLIAYYRAMMLRPDRTEVLKSASVPVLMVAGDEDMAAPVADLCEQASFPSICYFYLFEKTGHMGMLEQKVGLSNILLNFTEVV